MVTTKAKLCDLGFSKRTIESPFKLQKLTGMHEFMNYEVFVASRLEDQIICREKADVMSLALTVLNMASLDQSAA
jgi:hypothetical protein